MQKLSRVDKYREYRNDLYNDGEKEIVTKELRELQDKIIFNEKRFGNYSRTENDLNRGRKDTSYESILNKFDYDKIDKMYSEQNDDLDNYPSGLDDIFEELKRDNNAKNKEENKQPKLSRVENISNINNEKEKLREELDNDLLDKSLDNIVESVKTFDSNSNKEPVKNESIDNEFLKETSSDDHNKATDASNDIQDYIRNLEKEIAELASAINKPESKDNSNPVSEDKNDSIASFSDEKNIETKDESNVKEIVTTPVEPIDQFEEISRLANSISSIIEDHEVESETDIQESFNVAPNNSLESLKQDVKNDLSNSEFNNDFMDNLNKEVDAYNSEPETQVTINDLNDDKHTIKKSEISDEQKEEFDNTVSIEVSKLIDEINSSKSDDIAIADALNDNNIDNTDTKVDQIGKTIAFNMESNKDIENTVIISNPQAGEDNTIHTMSFKVEELDVEKEEKGNKALNVILSILIIISAAALGVLIYFFLITRGII